MSSIQSEDMFPLILPKRMSDQGACFESNVFKHLCCLIGSTKLRSSAYHPAGNGGIEVVNRVIKPNLAKYVNAALIKERA